MTSVLDAMTLAPAVACAHYNRGLIRAYEKASIKEPNWEHLLMMTLGVGLIQHILISLFPVVTVDPRIVVFSRITEFSLRADRIVAASEVEAARV